MLGSAVVLACGSGWWAGWCYATLTPYVGKQLLRVLVSWAIVQKKRAIQRQLDASLMCQEHGHSQRECVEVIAVEHCEKLVNW